jgi:uncharacterized membrane protein
MPALKALSWLACPLLILFGLRVFEPRHVALMLAACLLLGRGREAARLLAGFSRVERGLLAGLLLLAGTTAMANSELLLRLYPVAMNFGLLSLFFLSLFFPPSMIERFARLGDPHLPAAAIRYTRRLTQIWCAFFIANGVIALYTALCASRDAWALYNGLIAYLLMGALLGGERLFRRFFVRE